MFFRSMKKIANTGNENDIRNAIMNQHYSSKISINMNFDNKNAGCYLTETLDELDVFEKFDNKKYDKKIFLG